VRERQRLTYTDALTGLKNRARFNAVLSAFERDSSLSWGILLIDIDNLKLVNDTFGHAAGDDLIRIVAARIADAVEPDTTYRLGGDEFAVLVRVSETLGLGAVAEQILVALKDPSDCAGQVIFPAATIGGAVAGPGDSPDLTRQNADFALYDAKERNRGQYLEFHPAMGTSITKRFRAIRDVNLALSEGRIDAYYQPIVRLDTGEVVGFEALCRMRAVSGEIIAAGAFHEATKDGRVAAQLTDTMLRTVARDVRSWLDDGLPFQHVGVNLSAADFHIGRVHERIRHAFDAAGVPLKHIILEVTESVYLGGRDHAVAEEIRALRAVGIRVALDDFGTGFASLTHLLSLPVDIIKIDKSFIDRLVPGDKGLIIIEGLLGIAEKLGIRVVAEGIETSFQTRQLVALGCLLGQGYHFSQAVARHEARAILECFGQRQGRTGNADETADLRSAFGKTG
jgi:diguanylate cyclase (GGDEF)-like protein